MNRIDRLFDLFSILIKDQGMEEIFKNLVHLLAEDEEFRQFISREFDKTSRHATVEEMAEFAFGDMEEAKKEFEKQELETGNR